MAEPREFASGETHRHELADLLDAAVAIAQADFADIRLVDPASGRLRVAAQRGFPAAWAEYWNSGEAGLGLCRFALDRRRRLVVEDIDQDKPTAGLSSSARLRALGVRSLQSTPIIGLSGEVLGTFSTHSRAVGSLDMRTLRLLDFLAERAAATIAYARDAASLKASGARVDFFADLETALRPLTDPAEMEYEACRRLVERLDAQRCHLLEFDLDGGRMSVARDFIRNGAHTLAGTYRVEDFGWSVEIVRQGRCLVVADTQTSEIVPGPSRTRCAALGVISCIAVPLVKDGRLVAALSVTDSRSRDWTDADIDLVRDVGERIWAGIARVRAEAARRDSESLFRHIFEQSPVAIAIVRHGVGFLNVNASYARLVGYSPEELRQHHPSMLFHPEDRATDLAAAAQLRAGAATSFRIVNRYVHRTGRTIWVDKFVGTIPGEDWCVVMATDITEQRQADALRAHAHRLESLAQMTGGIAHDVNNLLATIALNLERADQLGGGDRGTRDPIAAAMLAVDQGASLTRRLLSFAQRNALKPTRVVPNDRMRDIEALLHRSLGEQVEVRIRLAPESWTVDADAGELDSAIVNLAVNARDAMPGGGRIDILVENVVLDERAASRTGLAAGPYVRIALSDTGTGMAPEILRRATEPFFTTKPRGRGTGLGLSGVYGFVRQSGGGLDIESEPGRGTRVSLCLPKAAASGATG